MKRRVMKSGVTAVTLGLLLTVAFGWAPVRGQQPVHPIMHQVFDAIAYLLPLSLAGKEHLSELDTNLMDTKLSVLAGAAEALREHAQGRDQEFRLLSRSFERDVRHVSYAFQNDRPIDAFYVLMDLTQNCAACHSRLPDQSDFEFGQKLLARIDVASLERAELAQLYTATRQFDRALETLEKALRDETVSPVDLELDGVLVEYLSLCIVVARDAQRPVRALTAFARRQDTPFYLRRRVARWQQDLRELADPIASDPSMLVAELLFARAGELGAVPGSRDGAVYDLVAAGMLRKLIENRTVESGLPLAQAYWMLAVITLRTLEPDAPVPQLEFLLESAIRAAPRTPVAEQAYGLLQEVGYVNYPGLSGLDEPHPLIDAKELSELVERERQP